MRLTLHTDYGLRFLTYVATKDPQPVSARGVSAVFGISPDHTMKVAQSLSKAGWLEPVRGRRGGFRLARPADQIRIGEVVRSLEPDFAMVECMKSAPAQCPITPDCRLPRLLAQATHAFLQVLDSSTLADLVVQNPPLIRLLELAS